MLHIEQMCDKIIEVLPFTVGGWLFAGVYHFENSQYLGGMRMRNLDGSKLGDRNCDYSCEYCSYDNQYHRNDHQYLQRIKK